ncbi:MAG: hypothetical protein IPP73_04175 [Chitinophagaceae bacterium]|nr:hypothetical protein [Chitinophagaceae bacterium]
MKPIASPLNIIDFAVINLDYKFIQPKKGDDIDVKKYFGSYDLDIDFAITKNEIIRVFIKSDINKGKKIYPGYSMSIEIACFFEFNEAVVVSESAKGDIGGFSTIYIALNALRGYVSQFTANAPYGRYIFPSVDLNDLIKQKRICLV